MRRVRKYLRHREYDYSQNGFYFITICIQDKECIFGDVIDGVMKLNKFGRLAELIWKNIPLHFNNVVLDKFVIMPDHIHGIIIVDYDDVGYRHAYTLRVKKRRYQLLPVIVGSYKSAVTKQIRKYIYNFNWQRSYHDRIIRNENELNAIRKYIKNNPLKCCNINNIKRYRQCLYPTRSKRVL